MLDELPHHPDVPCLDVAARDRALSIRPDPRIADPNISLADQIEFLLCRCANEVGAAVAKLVLHGQPALHCERRQSEVVKPADVGSGPCFVTETLIYGTREFGTIELNWDHEIDHTQHRPKIQRHASEIARTVQRHRVLEWSREHLGIGRTLVGASEPLRAVERHIERVCQTRLPVVIKGELGTELSTAAIAVHLGTLGDARLVILNCPALTPEMLERECGGQSLQHSSLFLQAADALSPAAQRALLSYLPAIPGSTAGPRLITSTTHDLEQMAREGSFLPELLAALDVLEIRIPPLRERQEDIGPIANHVLREHTQLHPSRKQVRHCHAELVALLCVHPWPGNVLELERTVLRLAVMADGEVLGVEHANRHARSSSLSDGTIETSSPAVVGTPEEWIEALVRMDHARFANVHEGLRRALIYIGEHYHEQVSLGPLAKSAFLSPSHLSYLLRTVVGTNFKTLLARLRIEHAKRLLGGDGQQQRVSDVAAAVGFGDLSHFEKTFRRFTAMSPREYRAAQSSTRPRR